MKITAHCLVKNEARFVWYSVMSIIDQVDQVLIWDTGSTDGTKELIKLIERLNDKVQTRFLKGVTPEEFTEVRQQMLELTKSDWFIVVDGDEIWWQESIAKLVGLIKKSQAKEIESIVVPTINLVGDIYHYQEKAAGHYQLAGKRGHLNLRAINRKIPGLHSAKPHGTWGWADGEGKMIQDRYPKKVVFLDAPYLHASFLPRAGTRTGDLQVPKRIAKLRHEIGISFAKDFYYPEVFFQPRQDIVPCPWRKMEFSFWLRALVETPLRKIKRRLIPARVGY